jgi:hypothetical protein
MGYIRPGDFGKQAWEMAAKVLPVFAVFSEAAAEMEYLGSHSHSQTRSLDVVGPSALRLTATVALFNHAVTRVRAFCVNTGGS